MKLAEIGEFALIAAIKEMAVTGEGGGEGVIMGIGDDVAVLRPSAGNLVLVTTDILLQDVHFTLSFTDPYSLGKKALGVNLSDIASCGGRPTHFLISLALPAETEMDFVKALYRGMMDIARQFNVSLVGGDTSRGRGIMICITLLGEAHEGQIVYRGGARQGDQIFVTGTLGDAALGLEMLKRGIREGQPVQRHLTPIPRVIEGRQIARQGLATAMIDISDGLLADLRHIAETSGVGAQIQLSQIPLSEEYRARVKNYSPDPYLLAITGGEDYELLFTCPPRKAGGIAALADELGTPITCIGEIVEASQGIKMNDKDGEEFFVQEEGYDHFKT